MPEGKVCVSNRWLARPQVDFSELVLLVGARNRDNTEGAKARQKREVEEGERKGS